MGEAIDKYIVFEGFRFCRDEKTGYYRCCHRCHGQRLLHRAVWASHNGEIPHNMSIHHIDGNKSNNDISNLALIGKSEHSSIHMKEIMDKEIDVRRERFIKHAIPAAKAWHSSADGLAFHSANGKKSLGRLSARTVTKVCEVCGEAYGVPPMHASRARFCSKKCKTKHRRMIGVDDGHEAFCAVCGSRFEKNKYSNKKTCSSACKIALFKETLEKNRSNKKD